MVYVFTQPFRHGQDVTQGQFLSGVRLNLNSSYSFPNIGEQTNAKELNLPYYLFLTCGRDWFMLFLKGIRAKRNANNLVQDLNSVYVGMHCIYVRIACVWVCVNSNKCKVNQ